VLEALVDSPLFTMSAKGIQVAIIGGGLAVSSTLLRYMYTCPDSDTNCLIGTSISSLAEEAARDQLHYL
jgi:hypothetical protein